MSTASEHLVRMTWMSESVYFKAHDNVTPVNWDSVWQAMSDGEFNEHQLVLIAVVEFLSGSEMTEISLDEIERLPQLERLAVLDSLKLHWPNLDFQEEF